jgi:hypothetical protein
MPRRAARSSSRAAKGAETRASAAGLASAAKPARDSSWIWLCTGAWFATSALLSTYFNSRFLLEFRGSAVGLTLVRFVVSALLGHAFNAVSASPLRWTAMSQLVRVFWFPSLLLLVANLFNSIALNKAGITVTYVTKAAIPVVTVVTQMLRRETIPGLVLVSLVPTVCGVALSAWSDVDVTFTGMLAAGVSTVAQALLNVYSKDAMQAMQAIHRAPGAGGSAVQAQMIMVTLASAMLAGGHVLSLQGAPDVEFAALFERVTSNSHSAMILLGAAGAYHVEYVLNFVVTANVKPVVFSVLDVSRRLAIVLCGALLFSKALSATNLAGVTIALAGVLWFSLLNQRLPQQPPPQRARHVRRGKEGKHR